MKISYAITVCDELHEVRRLLDLLCNYKREQDEIVVLLDKTKSSVRIENMLANDYNISLHVDFFQGHFADWKNKLNSFCTGDFIFQIEIQCNNLKSYFFEWSYDVVKRYPLMARLQRGS